MPSGGGCVTPTLLLQIHVDINYYKAPEPSSIIITAYFLNGPLLRLQQTLFRKIQMADIDSFVPLRELNEYQLINAFLNQRMAVIA